MFPWGLQILNMSDGIFTKKTEEVIQYPRISIVTPSFNQAQFIPYTIESVLSQGYPNLEYIVIDGGSTDGSVEIIKRYAHQLSYWVSEPDKGHADAIHKGFQKSTGYILGFLNSDDILARGALYRVADYFMNNQFLDVLVGAGGMIDSDGNFLHGTYPIGWNLYTVLSLHSRFMQPAVFYTKRAYEKVGGLNTDFKFSLDFDLFARFTEAKLPYQIIYDRLALTRLHPLTKTTNWQHIAKKEIEQIQQKHHAHLWGLKYSILILYWRIKHCLLRCRFEGIKATLTKRSRMLQCRAMGPNYRI